MTKELKCKDKVKAECTSRISDLRKLWAAYCSGENDGYVEDLGNLNEYGLSFDYVPPGTFTDQKIGFFRYQISWGGPSDEFRFYTNPDFSCYKVEYWFLDWFDGAKVVLSGKRLELLLEIFENFRECQTVEYVYNQAIAE